MERSELVEIRVGPSTITEVYAQRVRGDGVAWEENLRERRRRPWRADQVGFYWLLVGTAIGRQRQRGSCGCWEGGEPCDSLETAAAPCGIAQGPELPLIGGGAIGAEDATR